MEVSIESGGGLERRMKVAVPEDRIAGEINSRLETMARTVNIRGFRPGKVPIKVVKQRYGRQVREEVVGEMVRSSFQDALMKENLRPAGSPMIDEISSEPGAGLSYEAVFEIFPDISMPALEALHLKRPSCELNDADIDKMIETLRGQRRTWSTVERAAQQGDRVTIDFTGRCDGVEIKDGKAESMPVELGAGSMVPGFEDGLVGAKAGDDLTISVTFPEDVPDDALAGKAAQFEVHVHLVEASQLPDVDEEFVRGFGVSTGSGEDFREAIRANMGRELADAVRTTTKKRVMDALLDAEAVEVPGGLVEEEVQRMTSERRMELGSQGVDPEQVSFDSAAFEPEARRRVALGLLLGKIIKENDLKADPELVRERIETIASTYDESDKVVNWYYSNQERLQEIESGVLEDQVVDWVLERAQVSDEPTTFDELLNPGQTSEQHVDE